MSYATIEYSTEENENGVEVECVYAKCSRPPYDETDLIWGTSEESERAALAQLSEICTCGASWHTVRRECGKDDDL